MTTVMDPGDDENVSVTGGITWGQLEGLRPPSALLRQRSGSQKLRNIWLLVTFGLFLLMILLLLLADVIARNTKSTPGRHQEVLKGSDLTIIEVSIGAGALGILAFGIPWLATRRKYMKNRNVEFEERLKAEKAYYRQRLENLKKATELATLMDLNQGQIKTYHDIVTDQADKSFKSSRIAMGIGMLLLVAAAVGGAFVPLEQVRWFIGALAAFSTLLSGYLSRTYLSLYKESIGQLNRYFDQPVLNSYYLTAERLTEGLGEQHQDEIRMQVIREVLSNGARMGGKAESDKERTPEPRSKKRTPKRHTSSVNGTPQA
ncbi:hypothetical protein [Streptomyces sp. NPDC006309]|uniref:hypothetical protein n=1 Tax=Streptomyces sp. NPDC006309 TaxID=3156749 RepID=UPI0033A6AF35